MRPSIHTEIQSSQSFQVSSVEETEFLGKSLGELLRAGNVVGVVGEMGMGKTCFIRGVVGGLGVKEKQWVHSPSFSLINEYQGEVMIYHLDLYRLHSIEEMEELGYAELLEREGVIIVEWADRLPAWYLQTEFEIGISYVGTEKRLIHIQGDAARVDSLNKVDWQ